jgi:group I intron endonuclease
MSCGSIYKIVFPNGKHYIGLTTTSLEKRTKQHKNAANRGNAYLVCKAIRKYGMVDTLELLEVDTADTIEELCEKEIKYITEYDSYYRNGKGYNMTYGGEGTNGHVCTEEVKQKISKSLSGHVCTEKSKQKMSKAASKRFENPDAKKEHGKRIKQYYKENPDAKEKMSKITKKYYKDNPDARSKFLDGRGKNKPFDVFTKDGLFINTFTYQFEAKEYLQTEYNISFSFQIGQVLIGKRKSSKGFVFKYK